MNNKKISRLYRDDFYKRGRLGEAEILYQTMLDYLVSRGFFETKNIYSYSHIYTIPKNKASKKDLDLIINNLIKVDPNILFIIKYGDTIKLLDFIEKQNPDDFEEDELSDKFLPELAITNRKSYVGMVTYERSYKHSNRHNVSITFISLNKNLEDQEVLNFLRKVFEELENREKIDVGDEGVRLQLAVPSKSNDVDYLDKSIKKIHLLDLERNYTPNVFSQVKTLINKMKHSDHGIVIFYGESGTGKSYMIRSLLSEFPDRESIICSPARLFLSDLSLLNHIQCDFKKPLIILEDVGDLLSSDNVSTHIDITSNLLNITDGLSIMSDSIFVVSFNYELDKINPALLRYGRCLGLVKFERLPNQQAEELTKIKLPEASYTLSDIYRIKDEGLSSNGKYNKNKQEIGFRI